MEVNGIQNKSNLCTNCCQPSPAQHMQPRQEQLQYAQVQTPQVQNMQAPSTSGVHIQIINPSVTTAGAQAPTCNVNAPNYYPPNYYTENFAKNACDCSCSTNSGNNVSEDKKTNDVNGAGENNSLVQEVKPDSAQNSTEIKDSTKEVTTENESKKTEKKKVVELTDQYIMNLENYLNSQEKDIRLSAAKEVYARLEEDPSRKDDKALTALINKMLQDPDSEVRMLALAALDGRYVQGDEYTVGLLQNMQSKPDGYGQDAIDAAEILLKMSARQVDKEVEVDPARQKKTVEKKSKKETKKA